MTTPLLLTPPLASRFVERWLAADPKRADLLEQLCEHRLSALDFSHWLRLLQADAPTLPSAMRRLRNLLVSAIAMRDLSGQADLSEVVAAISHFADFAVRTHLDALYAAMTDTHGVPTGEESGQPQQMIVVGMGKLGGGELNVSSDIDLIFLYPEGGETVTQRDDQRALSNHEFFTRLGRKLIADIAEITADGFTFRVEIGRAHV